MRGFGRWEFDLRVWMCLFLFFLVPDRLSAGLRCLVILLALVRHDVGSTLCRGVSAECTTIQWGGRVGCAALEVMGTVSTKRVGGLI